jgi:hypothetical protein
MSTFNGHRPGEPESANSLKTDAARLGKTALVVGASVLVAYGLFRLLTPAPTEEHAETRSPAPQEPTVPPPVAEELAPSPLLTAIKGAMVSFLLGVAREKLHDFIAQFNPRTDASSRT